jgi:hypothetical protein
MESELFCFLPFSLSIGVAHVSCLTTPFLTSSPPSPCSAYSSVLKMEAIRSFETSVDLT